MELVDYADADYELTVQLETDPAVMAELGGARPVEEMPRVHRMRLQAVADGNWWFTIVPEPGSPPVGTIGVWPTTWQDEPAHETGWMVLPEYQGRGFARRALDMLLSRARTEPRFEAIHAFPGATNAASNALCRRGGFELIEEDVDVAFREQPLICNHWCLDTRE